MQWKIRIDEVHGHVVVETTGDVTGSEVVRMVGAVVGHPEWHPGRSILFDHRKADFSQFDFDGACQAVRFHETHDEQIGAAPSAIVVGDRVAFGVCRMWENVADGEILAPTHIFLDHDEAVQWLGEQDEQTELRGSSAVG